MNKYDLGADVIAAQLDRLVAGDLPESDRRSLLAWLDEEPTRWRACALAFLEAQVWEGATALAFREGEAVAEPRVQGSGFRAVGNALRGVPEYGEHSWSSWLAFAGAVLAAFAAGALAGRGSISAPTFRQVAATVQLDSNSPTPGPQLATVSVRTHLDPRLMAQVQLPVEPTTEPLAGASTISDYVRKLWERRGYELIEEVRYLPATMPDGRTVMVPVNRVHLKPKGTPVS